MPGSNKPVPFPKSFRDRLIRAREKRKLDHAGLVERVDARIKAGFEFDEPVSVEWLQAIENGTRKGRVPRRLVDLLIKSLQCDDAERHDILVTVFPTYGFGEYVGMLREEHEFSRSKLAIELALANSESGWVDEVISGPWVQLIEDGRKRKITRATVELLAEGLECDDEKRFKLLIEAGLNPLADAKGQLTRKAEFLLKVLYDLEIESREGRLHSMMRSANVRKFTNMTLKEILKVFERGGALIDKNDAEEEGKPPA